LEELLLDFDELAQEQKALGFSDAEGVRKSLGEAVVSVERSINGDTSRLAESDRARFLDFAFGYASVRDSGLDEPTKGHLGAVLQGI
jgi:hypothetical protein